MMCVDISFVITSFNYDRYIEKSVLSCLNQIKSGLKFEIIIVDDGSKDNTLNILKKFNFEQVSVYFLKNQGVEKASNFGFTKCNGKYAVRIDADDYIDKKFLKNIEPFLKNNNFYYSNYYQVDENDNVLKKIKLPPFNKSEIFSRGDFLATGTVLPLHIIKKFGLYNTQHKNCGLENFDLILRLIKNNIKGVHINKYLFYYRRHTRNLSNTKENDIITFGKMMMKKYNCEFSTNRFHPYELKIQ